MVRRGSGLMVRRGSGLMVRVAGENCWSARGAHQGRPYFLAEEHNARRRAH
jgi:hypothetical protein